MTCFVAKKDRPEYVQNLVLDFFQEMEGQSATVSLDTFLGKNGLGHTMAKRKTYHPAIKDRLAVKGCAMKSSKPNDFVGSKVQTIGDVCALVQKDLG
jgi:hypothetical protein